MDQIVGAGVLVGIAVASQAWEPLMELKGTVAWSMIWVLVFSVFVHACLNLSSIPQENGDSREKDLGSGGIFEMEGKEER